MAKLYLSGIACTRLKLLPGSPAPNGGRRASGAARRSSANARRFHMLRSRFTKGRDMRPVTSYGAISLLVAILALGTIRPADANPEGTMSWGVHITLASRWLDPAETEGIIKIGRASCRERGS